MEWFTDWTSWAWIIGILFLVCLEFYTLITKKMGDTLSEHIRRLLGIDTDPDTGTAYRGGYYSFLRFLFLLFFSWFIVHILFAIM